jgi:TolB-like protein/DNA-binding winged helix-turn-helix (wHTH) protein/Tfp pilus assembly protein PilF
MDTLIPTPVIFKFNSFELNTRAGELRKHGMRIRLQEQPFQVLAALLETPGDLVTREELRRKVWPEDTFVDFDHALNTAVKKIRAALSDDADAPRYVETVPRRGYRFIAPVTVASSSSASAGAAGVESDDSSEHHRSLWLTEIFSARIGVVSLLAVVLILGAVMQWSGFHRRARAAANAFHAADQDRVMVAVLPFQNLSGDASQEYFSDGMTEETISQLGRLNPGQLGVIARTSAMKYKHANKSVDEISKELHVDYLMEGSVWREGQRVRIAARLIRASDQSPRWAMNFDRNINDVISLQTEVAGAIASDIEKTLGNTAPLQAVSHTRSVVPDAYDSYLRAMSETGFHSRKEFERVLTTFGSAIKMDPNSAMAWAGLASAYDQAGNGGLLAPNEAFAKTKEAAAKAIELDPTDPDAHVYLADAVLTVDFNWSEAEKEIQQALKLNPNDANARQWYGLFLLFKGETNEAFVEMKRALTLDPLSTERMVFLGGAGMMAGRPHEAEFYLKMAIGIDPDLAVAHKYLAYAYEAQGKKELAINEMAEAYRARGETEAQTTVKQTYASAGFEAAKKAGLRQDIAFWKKAGKDNYIPAYIVAEDYGQLGDKEETIAWLQRAYDARDVHLLGVRSEQNMAFSSVKNEPGFRAIVNRIGYPQ